jgi:GntP family gluconate:H+ symporter
MMCVGLVVGVAVWFSVGLVLLLPIAFMLAKESGRSLLLPGIPMLAGLSVMHGLAPPHPGPMAAVALLGADTGRTICLAVLLALPLAVLAGPVFASMAASRVALSAAPPDTRNVEGLRSAAAPSLCMTLFIIALPVVLMLTATMVEVALAQILSSSRAAGTEEQTTANWISRALLAVRPWAAFIGSPTVAMLLAFLAAIYGFGFDRHSVAKSTEASLAPVGMILLVVGAGGAFSKVLAVCGVAKSVTAIAAGWELSPLLLGWVMAALIRIAVGSATVAISTAAGIVAPMAAAHPESNPEVLVLAMGAGSLILSHVNDAGFWFVKECFGLTVSQTFKTWTVLETILAMAALPLLLLLDLLI